MKTNLKRIGAWALCFMLLLSCIPVSADDGVDYSVGFSPYDVMPLDDSGVTLDGIGVTSSTSTNNETYTFNIPVYFYTNGVVTQSTNISVTSPKYTTGSNSSNSSALSYSQNDALTYLAQNVGSGATVKSLVLSESIPDSTSTPSINSYTFTATTTRSGFIIYTYKYTLTCKNGNNSSVTLTGNEAIYVEYESPIVTVNPITLTIGVDQVSSVLATVKTDSGYSSNDVVWSSDDPLVATVDNAGNVTGVAVGTTTIRATVGGQTAVCTVNVVEPSITLNYEVYSMAPEKELQLVAVVLGLTDQKVTWTTSDSSIATVDQDGKVVAIATGTVAIRATASNGLSDVCTVTIANYSESDIQDCYFYLLKPGGSTDDAEYKTSWYFLSANGEKLGEQPGQIFDSSRTPTGSKNTYSDLNIITPISALWKPTIQYGDNEYTYATTGAPYTYSIIWMYRKDSSGANTANSGTNIEITKDNSWHIDGYPVFHDPSIVSVNYVVQLPNQTGFVAAFDNDNSYPKMFAINSEHTVEGGLINAGYTSQGYRFDGWYYDEDFTQKVTDSTVILSQNTVFYGRWVLQIGTIEIEKTVDDSTFETGYENFYFSLQLQQGSGNAELFNQWKASHASAFVDGNIEVTVDATTKTKKVILSGLPVGTYTITEIEPSGVKEYTTTSTVGNGTPNDSRTVTITIADEQTVTASYVNTFVPKTADLTITKNVANLPAGNLNDDTFTFTVKDSAGNVVDTSTALQHDGSYTFEGLEAGTYTVTESVASAKAGGTAHSYEMTAAEDQKEITVTNNSFEITIVAGVDRSVTVTNTCNDTVDLTVKKVWEDEGFYYESETDPETGDDYEGFLRPSSVEMTLNVPDGVTLPTGVTAKATLRADEYGEWSHTWSGVPKYKDGAKIVYSVTEEPVSGYTAVKSTESFNENGEATITNAIDLGYIRLTKTFTDRRAVADLDDLAFTIAVKDSYGIDWGSVIDTIEESGSSSGTHTEIPYPIPVGTYTVTEISNENTKSLDAYNVSHRIGTEGEFVTGASAGTITVSKANTESDPVEIQFNNTLKTYSLTVEKQIAGNMADSQKDFTFTAKLLKPQSGEGDSGEEILTYVDSGLNFTNVGLTPSGANGVTFKLKANESITLDGIPYGYSVSVTESGTAGYTVETSQNGGSNWSTPTAAGADGSDTVGPFTYDADVQPKVIFKNTNNASIDTGVTLDFLPYVLLILGVGVVVALWLVMSAKKRKDD